MSNLAVIMWIFIFILYHANGYTNITCNNDNRCRMFYNDITYCNDTNGCHIHCCMLIRILFIFYSFIYYDLFKMIWDVLARVLWLIM